jgi:hypothetical protein
MFALMLGYEFGRVIAHKRSQPAQIRMKAIEHHAEGPHACDLSIRALYRPPERAVAIALMTNEVARIRARRITLARHDLTTSGPAARREEFGNVMCVSDFAIVAAPAPVLAIARTESQPT